MGLEIGWYLRFTKGDLVEALVDASTRGQLENALRIMPNWTMEAEESDGALRAVFRRRAVPKKTGESDE